MEPPSNLHTAWARLVVHALAASGVRDVVISPGSRSTPLALAAIESPLLSCHVHVDERVGAFFALGQARATGRPSVLLCTSGTAGAHWYPALIEASQSHLPMVLVTADRPWEAYDCAAPQTVDQVGLFGRYVRHEAELGLPDPTPYALRAAQRVAAQSVHRSLWPLPGPVHINARFRKPLEPVSVSTREPWSDTVDALLAKGPTRAHPPAVAPSPDAIEQLADACRRSARAWIVCGPAPFTSDRAAFTRALDRFAARTGFPVLAESTSLARFAPHTDARVTRFTSFDVALRAPAFRKRHRPDVIFEFGLPPTSGAYGSFLEAHPDLARHVVAPYGWPDPHGSALSVTTGNLTDVLSALTDRLDAHTISDETLAWARDHARVESLAWEITTRETGTSSLTEGVIPARLVASLPEGSTLVVGNSMPVRDIDLFCPPSARALRVMHQRGASGIDGLVSGAAGARSVTPPDLPVAVYVGDISLVHDLGGLNAARHARGPLVIVAVQNDGGRIFDQLPLAKRVDPGGVRPEHFRALFTTPQSLTFEGAARTFGLEYRRVETTNAYEEALAHALSSHTATLIEAVVDPTDATARRARIYAEVARAIESSP
jgi:2-succinyl-5-enolpyruvyl-6-hydroxy-3-cyclohexene-1-carboxylate synthase